MGAAVKLALGGSFGMALLAAPLLLSVIGVLLVAVVAIFSTAKRQDVLLAVMDRLITLATILRSGPPPSGGGGTC